MRFMPTKYINMCGYTTAMMTSLLIVSEAHEALHLMLYILNKELLSPWVNGLINPDKIKEFHILRFNSNLLIKLSKHGDF